MSDLPAVMPFEVNDLIKIKDDFDEKKFSYALVLESRFVPKQETENSFQPEYNYYKLFRFDSRMVTGYYQDKWNRKLEKVHDDKEVSI